MIRIYTRQECKFDLLQRRFSEQPKIVVYRPDPMIIRRLMEPGTVSGFMTVTGRGALAD